MRRHTIQDATGVIVDYTGVGLLQAAGTTVPTDATAGYATGCIFHKTNGGAATSLYINEGTSTSCAFKAVDTAASLAGTGGAALVGILDSGNFTAQTTVEAALAEIYQHVESAQGFIHLPLNTWRLVESSDVPALANTGGNLARDSAPKLIRVSTSTDKCLTIAWAASSGVEIFNQFAYPPDMDVTTTYTINLRIKSGGATDTPTPAIGVFEGVGDTNRGTTTPAITSAISTKSITVTPTTAHPMFANVVITPGTHTTDTVVLYEAYVLYKKKLLTS